MEQLSFALFAVDSAPVLCACGCGMPTPLARTTDRSSGLIAGQPTRFIKGHGRRKRIDDNGRECGECGTYKPWDDFHISRTTRHGHVTTCKPCMAAKAAAQTAERRTARPPKIKPLCSILGCGKPVSSHGWCKRHYENERLYGNPLGRIAEPPERPDLPGENWLPIPTWEGLYEVSDHGRVWSVPRLAGVSRRFVGGRILKGDQNDPRGYVRVGLKRPGAARQEHHNVHRLVLWAFTGENPPDLDTRHLDGNPANNRWAPGNEAETVAAGGNLMYGTASENACDRVRHGTWVNNNRFVGVTECIHGHKFDEANTYWRPKGGRSCKACARERRSASRMAAKEAA